MINQTFPIQEIKNIISSRANLHEIIFIFIILCILTLISSINYLLFHSLVEMAGLSVAFSIFIIIWNTKKEYTDGFFLIIGISFFFFGIIDLLHTLAYEGIGVFPGNNPDLPTQLWIAARFFQSITFLFATLFIGRSITRTRRIDTVIIITACILICSVLLTSILIWQNFPHCYIEGTGLTEFKIVSEYLISFILIVTIFILYRKREHFDKIIWKLLISAQIFLILGELAFTSYVSVFGFMNMLGHLFRFVSVYLFYRIFIVISLTRPYDLILYKLKENESILKESIEEFRIVFDQTSHFMGILDRQGILTKINSVAIRYLESQHINPESVLSIPFWLTPWWTHDTIQQKKLEGAISKALTGEMVSFETTQFSGSNLMHIDFSLKPVKDKDGNVNLLIAEGWDITEIKKIEQELQKLDFVVQYSPAVAFIWRVDEGWPVEYVSKNIKQFGYRVDDFLSGNLVYSMIIYPEDLLHVIEERNRQSSEEGCEHFSLEYRILTAEKNILWVDDHTWIKRDNTGRITHYHGIILDITERKKMEDTVVESKNLLNAIIQDSPIPQFVIDKNHRIIHWNIALEKCSGIKAEEILGTNYQWRAFYVNERPCMADILVDGTIENIPIWYEGKYTKSSLVEDAYEATDFFPNLGSSGKWLHFITAVIKDFNGRIIGAIETLEDITERKQAEEAVQAAIQLNQQIDSMSASECMVFTIDEAERLTNSKIGFFHFFNPDEQTIQLIAWSTQTQKHCFIPKEPDKHYPIKKAGVWVDCLREHKPVIHNNYTNLLHKKGLPEGHVPVTRELVVPIFERDKIVAIIGVGNKITDYDEKDINILTLLAKNAWTLIQRKHAEEEMQKAQKEIMEHGQFLQLLIDTIPNPIFYKNRDGLYTGCNIAFEEYLGFSRDYLIGKSIYDISPKELADTYYFKDKELFEKSGTQVYESQVKYADGSIHDVIFNKATFYDSEGNVDGLVGIILDISERKLMENALRESEERFRTITETSLTGIYIFEDGLVRYVNPTFAKILGYTSQELIGTDPLSFVHPDDVAMVKERMLARITQKEDISMYEFRLITKDNRIIFVNIMGTIIPFEGRRAISGNLMDITERKKAEKEERLTKERFETLLKVSEMKEESEVELSEYVMEAACRMTNSTLAFIGLISSNGSVMDIVSWSKSAMKDCRITTSPIHFSIKKAGIWADAIRSRAPKIMNDYSVFDPAKKGLPEGHVPITRFLSLPIVDKGKVVMVVAVANKPFDYDDTDSTRLMLLMQGVWANLEKRKSEKLLKDSEDRFRELFNSMSSGVAVYQAVDNGADFEFIDFNPGAEKIEQISKEDVIGRRVTDVFPGVFKFGIIDVFKRVWLTGKPEYHPLFYYEDKRIASWRENYVYRLPSGEIVAVYDDVTERKQAEDALRRSEQEWETTFNAITDVVFLLDEEGKIIRHNHALEIFCGKTADEIDGNYCYEVMHGTSYPLDDCPYKKAQNSKKREFFELNVKDRWFVAAVDPVFSDSGDIIGAVHLLIDITERKLMEEAIRQANKKLNLLSSITRHDISNQLQLLTGFLELSKDVLDDEKTMSGYIIKIEKAADAIKHQIIFTREYQDMGLSDPNWQKVDACVKIAESSLPMKDIQLMNDCQDVELYADPLLEKVFYNLIDNALRYGGPDMTKIHIISQEKEEGLTITLEDDGFGIAPENKKRIFERGFGLHTGLGLFLTREILSITGITIEENGELGKGARFYIFVPKGNYRFSQV